MVERRYTVAEIDELRSVIDFKLSKKEYITAVNSIGLSEGLYTLLGTADPVLVESHLRTHMLAGHVAADLKEIRKEILEKKPEWYLIKDTPPPEGHEEFMVGAWMGETLWDDIKERHLFVEEPVWRQTISHNEDPSGPHKTRGWNHRNGALGGNATHWAYINTPALPDIPYLIVPENQRAFL